MKHLLIIVGTRPNFIKVTQFKQHANAAKIKLTIVHTGQHYDREMADIFFDQFGLRPDIILQLSEGSSIQQMGEMMWKLEKEFEQLTPDMILVCGDVNSSIIASFVANRMGIKLGHIESGLRSRDRRMPEEINRILVDDLSDVFYVTEQSGYENLVNEGKSDSQIVHVGNTMIDTLVAFQDEIDNSKVIEKLGLRDEDFVLMTMHRPSNVDSLDALMQLDALLDKLTNKVKVVFPTHPRTKKRIEELGISKLLTHHGLIITEPLGYFAFQKLIKSAKFIVTDSGGIQEETTFLQIPCLTIRPNTERPITTEIGTNTLLDFHVELIMEKVDSILTGTYKSGDIPNLWDGRATERIIEHIVEYL
jgi:UDP-N-acetylglucosamine 2-epimerase (non-hydrolysing)